MAQTVAAIQIRGLRPTDVALERRGNEVLLRVGQQVRIVCASPGNTGRDVPDLRAESAALRELAAVAARAAAVLAERADELEEVAA